MTTDILKFQAAAKGVTQAEVERIVNKYLAMDRAQVQDAITNRSTPMIELLLAAIVANAAQKGDPVRAEFILAQLRRSTLRSDSSK